MGFWITHPCGCENNRFDFVAVGPNNEYQAPEGQHIVLLYEIPPEAIEANPKFPAVKQASSWMAEFQDCPSYKKSEEVA